MQDLDDLTDKLGIPYREFSPHAGHFRQSKAEFRRFSQFALDLPKNGRELFSLGFVLRADAQDMLI